jgi:hypothetical protein
VRRAMYGAPGGKGRKRLRESYVDSDSGSEGDSEHRALEKIPDAEVAGLSRSNPVIIVDEGLSIATHQPQGPASTAAAGSALTRTADGNLIAPRVVVRKTKREKKASIVASCQI